MTYLDTGDQCPAVTNVGVRPTFSRDGRVTVETHLLDHAGNLYGHRARVEFLHFLRPEQRFSDGAALAVQIAEDEAQTRRYFQKRSELK